MMSQLNRFVNTQKYNLWKAFRVTNFMTLIRPYAFVVCIFGFFPYKTVSTTYTLSKKRFVWSTIIVISCLILTPTCVCQTKLMGRRIRKVSPVFHYYCDIFLGLVFIWANYVSTRSKLLTYQKMSNVSRVLLPKTFCSMAKWMYTIDLIRIIVLGCFWIESMWRTSSMLFNVLSWYMVMVNVLVNMLFVNNLNVLKACLSKINEFLESLKKTLINDEPHLLRRVYHTQKNPVLLMELKACRRQHLEISKIIEIFNEAFGFENIVTVAITLVGVTFNISDYLEVNTNDVKAFAIDRIVYLTYISLHLVLIIVTCEKLKNEAKTIGINIHRILVVTSNRQLTTQLEFFSIQALQQNHTILAKGLVIDATLLTKLIGSITTYVLILVQFIIVKHC